MKTIDIVKRFILDDETPKAFRELALLSAEEFDKTGQFGGFTSQAAFVQSVFQFEHMDLLAKLERKSAASVEVAEGKRIYDLLKRGFGRSSCMTGYHARYARVYMYAPVFRLLCLSIDNYQARRLAIRLDTDQWFLDTTYASVSVLKAFMSKHDPLGITKPVVERLLWPAIYRSKKDCTAYCSTFLLQYPKGRVRRQDKPFRLPVPFCDTFMYWVILPLADTDTAYQAIVQMHNSRSAAVEAHQRVAETIFRYALFEVCHTGSKRVDLTFKLGNSDGMALTNAVKQIGLNVVKETKL